MPSRAKLMPVQADRVHGKASACDGSIEQHRAALPLHFNSCVLHHLRAVLRHMQNALPFLTPTYAWLRQLWRHLQAQIQKEPHLFTEL